MSYIVQASQPASAGRGTRLQGLRERLGSIFTPKRVNKILIVYILLTAPVIAAGALTLQAGFSLGKMTQDVIPETLSNIDSAFVIRGIRSGQITTPGALEAQLKTFNAMKLSDEHRKVARDYLAYVTGKDAGERYVARRALLEDLKNHTFSDASVMVSLMRTDEFQATKDVPVDDELFNAILESGFDSERRAATRNIGWLSGSITCIALVHTPSMCRDKGD